MSNKITFTEFVDRVDQEGLEYTICNFYPKNSIETLQNEALMSDVLEARHLINKIMCKHLGLWHE